MFGFGLSRLCCGLLTEEHIVQLVQICKCQHQVTGPNPWIAAQKYKVNVHVTNATKFCTCWETIYEYAWFVVFCDILVWQVTLTVAVSQSQLLANTAVNCQRHRTHFTGKCAVNDELFIWIKTKFGMWVLQNSIYCSWESQSSIVVNFHWSFSWTRAWQRAAWKLTKVFMTFSHKILERSKDSQPISNIMTSIDKKKLNWFIICRFLQNFQKHTNNHILNVGLSLEPWFRLLIFGYKKIRSLALDKHLNFHNLFTKLIYL